MLDTRFLLLTMRALGLALILSLLACSSSSEAGTCTEIGCSSGLSVQFTGAHQPGPWTVEVSATGEPPRTVTCGANLHCGNPFFENWLPAMVTVSVTANGRTETHTDMTPTPRLVRPNGPQCTPECSQPFLTVPVPQP
jgi:hypothetical protein